MAAIGAVVATGGVSLAVSIPAASAAKPAATYCEYNEYTQYNQYCEPGTPASNPPAGSSAPTGVTFTIAGGSTAGAASTTSAALAAGVTLSKDGAAAIDLSKLTVGETFTANGVAVKVLGKTADGLEMSFGGVAVDVPFGATVVISANGTVTVTYFKTASGQIVPAYRVQHATAFKPLSVVGEQDVILPAGVTSQKFRYLLPSGVSFGKTTWAQVAKVYTIQATGKRSLRSTLKPAKLANVSFDVAANKVRDGVAVKLAKAQSAYAIKFNVGKLQYTKAEQATITKRGVKTLNARFVVVSQKGKKLESSAGTFTYPVA